MQLFRNLSNVELLVKIVTTCVTTITEPVSKVCKVVFLFLERVFKCDDVINLVTTVLKNEDNFLREQVINET